MKLAIVGSRDVQETEENLTTLLEYLSHVYFVWEVIDEIVSGGARGADSLAEQAASRLLVPCKVFPANWDNLGKRAGFARNQLIADCADAGIALLSKPLTESNGTCHTVNMLRQQGKNVLIVRGF